MGRRGRPRKYTHKYRCSECGSNRRVKNGKSRDGKQRYLCKECRRNFTIGAERLKKAESLKKQALKMIAEGSSISAVSRILNGTTPKNCVKLRIKVRNIELHSHNLTNLIRMSTNSI